MHALGQVTVVRHPVRDARVSDLAFGAHKPLRDSGFRDEEGTRDLLGGQTAQQSEREGDPRFEGERRVTAREDQAEPVVVHGAFFELLVVGHG